MIEELRTYINHIHDGRTSCYSNEKNTLKYKSYDWCDFCSYPQYRIDVGKEKGRQRILIKTTAIVLLLVSLFVL